MIGLYANAGAGGCHCHACTCPGCNDCDPPDTREATPYAPAEPLVDPWADVVPGDPWADDDAGAA